MHELGIVRWYQVQGIRYRLGLQGSSLRSLLLSCAKFYDSALVSGSWILVQVEARGMLIPCAFG